MKGSLTATLMACDVDAQQATEAAVRMLRRHKVYERPMGLVGVRERARLDSTFFLPSFARGLLYCPSASGRWNE